MDSTRSTLAAQLVVARELISKTRLDSTATLAMLKALPEQIDGDMRTSVEEALKSVAATNADRRNEAFARFALARVIVMLERTLASAL